MMPILAAKDTDEELLASLGYKQEFKREFKPIEVFGLVFSSIGLVSSIASVLSSTISNGGAVSMVWGWVFGTFFILCIAIALGELASSAPTSGGLYYLTYRFASPRYRRILCWIVGYSATIGLATGIAAVNWGCTVQIVAAANIGSNGRLIITNTQSYGIFAAIVLSQAILCSLGTKVLARIQRLYIACNILLCLVVIIALPIVTPRELMNSPSYVFGNFTNLSTWPDAFSFILGLLTPLWTLGCFDPVIHVSEESSNAAVSAPWGMVTAISAGGVLGWLIIIVLAFCMGPNLSSILNSPVNQPMAQIFLSSFGQSWTLVIWSFVILVQYMMGSTTVLVASRQSFAFARDGALPLSNILYRINRYTGTPVNTVWFDCGFALLIGLLVFAGSAAVNAAFTIAVMALYVEYIIPIVSRFAFENDIKPGPFSVGVLSAPIAAISVIFMVFMFVMFCFPSSPQPQMATMNYTSVVFGGVLFLAMGWYYFPVYGGVHWFRGPAFNVDREEIRDEFEEKAT